VSAQGRSHVPRGFAAYTFHVSKRPVETSLSMPEHRREQTGMDKQIDTFTVSA